MTELEWQALGAIATIVGIVVTIWLVPDARRGIISLARRGLVTLKHNLQQTTFRVGLALILSLGSTALAGVLLYRHYADPVLLIGSMTLGFALAIFTSLLILKQAIDTDIRRLQSRSAELAQMIQGVLTSEITAEVREVREKWPTLCAKIGESPGYTAVFAIMKLSKPVSVEQGQIVASVPAVLKQAVASFEPSRVEPFIREIYGKPYRLQVVISDDLR